MTVIEVSPWVPAVLIEVSILLLGAAIFLHYRTSRLQQGFRDRVMQLQDELEETRDEFRRSEQEALRKRKIVTFEEADLESLIAAGEMAGDEELFETLKGQLGETADALNILYESSVQLNQKLSDVMEKQMEAVNMVGRLGGTGGLPPEVKEKAEAILDVFRMMDEILSVAYEDTDKLEGGLAEAKVAVTEFRDADPRVKLPTAEVLNTTLQRKSGGEMDESNDATSPPMNAFDSTPNEARV